MVTVPPSGFSDAPPQAADSGPAPHPPDLVQAFAEKIACPGSRALYLADDNTAAGRDSIPAASRSGRAFCVQPHSEMFVVDCDEPDRADLVYGLQADLARLGMEGVLVASGRPGNLHLFCCIDDDSLREEFRARATAQGLDVRDGNKRIRPPLSPHRLGCPVRLLSPDDPAEALAALSPRPITKRPLTSHMAELLKGGDYQKFGYPSRSEPIQALALAAVNKGWPQRAFQAALLDPANRAGDKLRKRPDALSYLSRCWRKAVARAAKHPPIQDRADAIRLITAIEDAVGRAPWGGGKGIRNQQVIKAMLAKAKGLGRIHFHASARDIAVMVGVSYSTVSRAWEELQSLGWLKSRGASKPGFRDASVWEVCLPGGSGSACNTPISHVVSASPLPTDDPEPPRNTPVTGGCKESVAIGIAPSSEGDVHEVWRRGGLRPARLRVFERLDAVVPTTAQSLATALGVGAGIVRRYLRNLEANGLAARTADAWLRGSADLDAVAARLGVLGQRDAQEQRYKAERARYEEALAEEDIIQGRLPGGRWRDGRGGAGANELGARPAREAQHEDFLRAPAAPVVRVPQLKVSEPRAGEREPRSFTFSRALTLPTRAHRSRYAHPWPDVLPRSGARRVGPFTRCSACRMVWTWVRYGDVALCLTCADERE